MLEERNQLEQTQRHVNPYSRVQNRSGEEGNMKFGWDPISKDHRHLSKDLGLFHKIHEEKLKGLAGNFIRLCQTVTE